MLLEDAGLACAAGLSIDIGQLRELTGYALEEDAQPQAGGFGGLANSAPPLQTLAKPLQNARTPSGATGVPQKGAEASTAILRGFADDTGPAAERIKSLLDRLDAGGDVREEAARLAEELPSLMPGDPAMAAVLEEAMAEAFAQAAGGEAAANSTDANGAEHAEAGSGNGGQFVGKGGGAAEVSDTVKRITDGAAPDDISEHDARAALREGFSVGGPNGSVKFGEELLTHIDEHAKQDAGNRLSRLKYAVDTVSDPDTVETNHRGDPRGTRYFKAYGRFGMNVYTGKNGNGIEIAWGLIGKRKERK